MRRHSRRRGGSRRGRNRNPVILSNSGRRRHSRRRGRRSWNPVTRFFNPDFKGIPGKALASVKSVASVDNLKKAGVVVATIAAGWALPAKFAPAYDSGLKGVGLTALSGALVATALGVAMPALAPVAILGAGVAAGLKALLIYGRAWLGGVPMSGIGDFLTLGQIPASMIQGGNLGSFLTTSGPVAAMGPGRSAALGGENFSSFS